MTSERLDSWKEIAGHLNRSVRTVTRWEREEGLPVHRHLHSKSGTVYAYKAELDDWWKSRGETAAGSEGQNRFRVVPRFWIVASAAAVLLALSAIVWLLGARRPSLPESRLVPLTTYAGIEGPPSLSPDGNQVTFERNGDIFVKQVDSEALVQITSTALHEYGPAWSPDGRQIAFTREGQGIFVISPLGGADRKIADTQVPLLLKTIAWTSDARSLVISEMTSPVCASLFVISVDTGAKRRLTMPPEPSIGDGWPAVSPDGRTVAFARYSQDTSANLYVVPLSDGEPRQLMADKASIFGIAWTSNADLVFSSDRGGSFRLWRLSSRPSSASSLATYDIAGEDARFPSTSRSAAETMHRLADQRR